MYRLHYLSRNVVPQELLSVPFRIESLLISTLGGSLGVDSAQLLPQTERSYVPRPRPPIPILLVLIDRDDHPPACCGDTSVQLRSEDQGLK